MNKLLFYKVETPLHMGSGSELGIVDMPIQRELVTGFPKMEASGIKGSMRRVFKDKYKNCKITESIFGPEEDGSEHSSCIKFTDSRILFFPVKSAKGIFGWITCPFVLERFKSEYSLYLGKKDSEVLDVPKAKTIISKASNLIIDKGEKNKIVLDEYYYEVSEMSGNNILNFIIENIAYENSKFDLKEKLAKDIVVLADDEFKFFTEMGTEINTRIRIGDKGVVDKDKGSLFTEEYLPVESILYSFVGIEKMKVAYEERKEILKRLKVVDTEGSLWEEKFVEDKLKNLDYIQLGGNSTLGKGITRVILGGN